MSNLIVDLEKRVAEKDAEIEDWKNRAKAIEAEVIMLEAALENERPSWNARTESEYQKDSRERGDDWIW